MKKGTKRREDVDGPAYAFKRKGGVKQNDYKKIALCNTKKGVLPAEVTCSRVKKGGEVFLALKMKEKAREMKEDFRRTEGGKVNVLGRTGYF